MTLSVWPGIVQKYAATGTPLPLEELFLEGRQSPSACSALVASLVHLTSLKRLALYHLSEAKPGLIHDIHTSAPQLEALTLVHGDTSDSVEWPCPLVSATMSQSCDSRAYTDSQTRWPCRAERIRCHARQIRQSQILCMGSTRRASRSSATRSSPSNHHQLEFRPISFETRVRSFERIGPSCAEFARIRRDHSGRVRRFSRLLCHV